jgi:hypothetical protein
LSRLAPAAGLIVLLAGILGHLAGWSIAVPLAAAGVMAAAMLGTAWLTRRTRPTTDEIAARVDADAGLSGELRSAHWFATAPAGDDWTAFHVEQAAGRCSRVEWRTVYPPAAARGAWLAAAVLVAAAFVLPAGLPSWPAASASVPSTAEILEAAVELDSLPPEVRDQLLELLSAIQSGTLTPEEALAKLRELTSFAKLAAERQQEIAELLEQAVAREEGGEQARTADPLAGSGMTEDVKWARENMASRLASEEAQRSEIGKQGPDVEQTDRQAEMPMMPDAAGGETEESAAGKMGMRVPAKPTGGPEDSSGMLLRNRNAAIGDPGSAPGGKRGTMRYGTNDASTLAAALKREMIEANVNIDRSNLDHEERRRKTEQSWSALRYTRATGRLTFDRARTDAPQSVPEARRPLVGRYFVREAPGTEPPPAGAPAPARRPE